MVKSSPLLPSSTWLEELARQIDRTREVVEPEAVHRLRVAAGRLSVWLELGARRALRDDLRRLRRSAAPVRDLDVLTAHEAGAAWAESLRTERSREAVSLRTALASPQIETLIIALGLVPDPDAVHVRSGLQRMKRRVMRAGDRLDESEGEEAALHRLRRRVRRLRYALEWMGADAAELRGLQEHLGGMNDLSVELARLQVRAGDLALASRREAVRRELLERRDLALEAWRTLRPRIGEL